jgi:glycosyltransferase involved in cell wall biosynthesis
LTLQNPLSPRILLVTPVWNDATRLAGFGADLARVLAGQQRPIRWLIADDGSGPEERARLADLQRTFAAVYPAVDLHLAAKHRGKGAVVREAWSLAPDADWLAFVDADGSVTALDFLNLIETAVTTDESTIAVRVNTATTRVEASVLRSLLHHAYLALADLLLNLRSADLQCGAKVMRAVDYRKIAGLLREEGFAFDSEMLCALQRNGVPWQEVPVNWIGKNGGKVNPLRDGISMLQALHRIRRNMAVSR